MVQTANYKIHYYINYIFMHSEDNIRGVWHHQVIFCSLEMVWIPPSMQEILFSPVLCSLYSTSHTIVSFVGVGMSKSEQ